MARTSIKTENHQQPAKYNILHNIFFTIFKTINIIFYPNFTFTKLCDLLVFLIFIIKLLSLIPSLTFTKIYFILLLNSIPLHLFSIHTSHSQNYKQTYEITEEQSENEEYIINDSNFPQSDHSPNLVFLSLCSNLSNVVDKCQRMGIRVEKNPDAQLESAYAMSGLKATNSKTNQICFIFVSSLKPNSLSVSAYCNGGLILKRTLNNEGQLPDFIINSLEAASKNSSNSKTIEEEFKQIEKLFQNLNKHSEKVLQKANSEMMAVQEIKTSQEYLNICNQAKIISLEVRELAKVVKALENKAKTRNEALVNSLTQTENEKEELKESLYAYSEAIDQLDDVTSLLTRFIGEQKDKIKSLDFTDEKSFGVYLDELIACKRLENQKRYLSES